MKTFIYSNGHSIINHHLKHYNRKKILEKSIVKQIFLNGEKQKLECNIRE